MKSSQPIINCSSLRVPRRVHWRLAAYCMQIFIKYVFQFSCDVWSEGRGAKTRCRCGASNMWLVYLLRERSSIGTLLVCRRTANSEEMAQCCARFVEIRFNSKIENDTCKATKYIYENAFRYFILGGKYFYLTRLCCYKLWIGYFKYA